MNGYNKFLTFRKVRNFWDMYDSVTENLTAQSVKRTILWGGIQMQNLWSLSIGFWNNTPGRSFKIKYWEWPMRHAKAKFP